MDRMCNESVFINMLSYITILLWIRVCILYVFLTSHNILVSYFVNQCNWLRSEVSMFSKKSNVHDIVFLNDISVGTYICTTHILLFQLLEASHKTFKLSVKRFINNSPLAQRTLSTLLCMLFLGLCTLQSTWILRGKQDISFQRLGQKMKTAPVSRGS